VSIQDMGAAGLTSSSVEMSSKGEVGIEIEIDRVPKRETGMTAYEVMLSESQERMLMVLKPGREDVARKIFEKWELDFAVIGHVTDTGRLVVKQGNRIEADIPVAPLVSESPLYDRPWVKPAPAKPAPALPKLDVGATLLKLMGTPDLASKRWIWEQYDHMVMGDTVQRPGGDAGVVRLHGSNRGLAITTDVTPRYCAADPREGGKQAVAEAWRNLTAVGARPLAVTDNMNFGNPEKPEIMGQFVLCVEGAAEACRALDFPVVSGNVSLYNETDGVAISPTPAIGAVGLIDDLAKMATRAFKRAGETIVVVGETKGHVGASIALRELAGSEDGAPPPVDLTVEKRNGDFVRAQILTGAIIACHDVSDGGLLIAIAEMALAGKIGATLTQQGDAAFWFGEDQARYVVSTADPVALAAAAKTAGVPAATLGTTGGDALTAPGAGPISLARLAEAHEGWLPGYMAAP
jgi:phosphoribosylformylglycinamidine synthase